MILKGSQRGGTRQLGLHLLKTEENEHVEIHEISGFTSDDIVSAMSEIQAVSKGTRCKQPLFSVSLSPPQNENVRLEVFEHAIGMIEERLGLAGQPRMIVFHEKEGRRHAHAVWSRIDAETMTAKNLSFFKANLRDIAKQLFLENGWQMPQGYVDSKLRDPRNFTLSEWQAAKRTGVDPRDIKQAIRDSYAASDNVHSFTRALEERGLFLAQGDRRGFVAVSFEGQVFAIASVTQQRTKDVGAKLGDSKGLKTVAETVKGIGEAMNPRLKSYIAEAKRLASNQMKPMLQKRDEMKLQHQKERRSLDAGQKIRHESESADRAARLSTGFKGVWDRLRGEHSKIIKSNAADAIFCLMRDREQRQALIQDQLRERQELQRQIVSSRERLATQILALHKQAYQYRQMEKGVASGQETGRSNPEMGLGLE